MDPVRPISARLGAAAEGLQQDRSIRAVRRKGRKSASVARQRRS